MNRRSFLTVLIGTPALAAVVAACGDDNVDSGSTTPADGIVHPTGVDDVVFRLAYEGGFVPVGVAFVNLPTLLVSGDGRVFQQGATTLEFPDRLLPAITVQTITEAGIQNLLRAATDAGLIATPPDYTSESMVADAPDTVVVINADGGSFTHRAYALDFPDAAESTPARENLSEFVALVGDLPALVGTENLGAATAFQAAELRFQAMVVDEVTLAGYDPQPTIVDWPADADVRLADALECARSGAASVRAAFTDATQLTFFREADVVYQVAAIDVLPGDAAC